jgi:hypothetical protein
MQSLEQNRNKTSTSAQDSKQLLEQNRNKTSTSAQDSEKQERNVLKRFDHLISEQISEQLKERNKRSVFF